jgi:hypothetical protein
MNGAVGIILMTMLFTLPIVLGAWLIHDERKWNRKRP